MESMKNVWSIMSYEFDCTKDFDMEAKVNLGPHQVSLKVELKVMGLRIDGKLRWAPHIKKVQAKYLLKQWL